MFLACHQEGECSSFSFNFFYLIFSNKGQQHTHMILWQY